MKHFTHIEEDPYSLELPPDNHREKIDRHFHDNPPEEIQADQHIKTYVICFTSRCGSNYFASGLSSDPALGLATEPYIPMAVINWANRFGIQGLEAYTARKMRVLTTPANIFGVKLGANQLLYLAQKGIIRKFWRPPVFIRVRRNNTVAQAVSYMIAMQTDKWSSRHEGNGKSLKYDPALILRFLKSTHLSNAIFDYYFDIHQIKPIDVVYENIDTDFPRAAGELARLLGLHHSTASLSATKTQRQATELNREFEKRFRDHFRSAELVS